MLWGVCGSASSSPFLQQVLNQLAPSEVNIGGSGGSDGGVRHRLLHDPQLIAGANTRAYFLLLRSISSVEEMKRTLHERLCGGAAAGAAAGTTATAVQQSTSLPVCGGLWCDKNRV